MHISFVAALTPPVVMTALTVAALAGLLVAEAREWRRAALLWKTTASAGFVLLAVLLGGYGVDTASEWVLVGLCLAALGDVALALPGERWFLAGLGAFLLGHVAYVVAFAARVPVATWLTPFAVAPGVMSLGSYVWLSPHLGTLRVPVIAYIATITAMVIGAMAVHRGASPGSTLLLAGALLFYVSDLSVAMDRFVARRFVNRLWGLPAYYAAQLFMAWATAG